MIAYHHYYHDYTITTILSIVGSQRSIKVLHLPASPVQNPPSLLHPELVTQDSACGIIAALPGDVPRSVAHLPDKGLAWRWLDNFESMCFFSINLHLNSIHHSTKTPQTYQKIIQKPLEKPSKFLKNHPNSSTFRDVADFEPHPRPRVPRSAAVPVAWAAVARRPGRTSGAGRVAAVPGPRGIESRPGGGRKPTKKRGIETDVNGDFRVIEWDLNDDLDSMKLNGIDAFFTTNPTDPWISFIRVLATLWYQIALETKAPISSTIYLSW
jgi:hypothetical protein